MNGVYDRVGTRFRVVIPLIMGAISVPLVIWDIHNAQVIYSAGMGWDTGAPVWPYRTPEILLWWFQYGVGFWNVTTLLMLRFLTPAIWFVASATLATIHAKRVLNSRRHA